MPFTNVVLLNCSDSAYIAGAITKDDGSFPIATDKQDRLLCSQGDCPHVSTMVEIEHNLEELKRFG